MRHFAVLINGVRQHEYTKIDDARDCASDARTLADAFGLSRYEHPIYVLTLDDGAEVSRETIL